MIYTLADRKLLAALQRIANGSNQLAPAGICRYGAGGFIKRFKYGKRLFRS